MNKLEWISVENLLPSDEYGMYLTFNECNDQEWQSIAHYENKVFYESVVDKHTNLEKMGHCYFVTHWMPLPDPPKNELNKEQTK